jgi:predicted phage tail protein
MTTFNMPPEIVARRLRDAEHARIMAEKTRPAREAAERERQMRAELHRIAALPELADALAGICFDVVERDRVVIRAHLAEALHARLLRSGLIRDLRWPPPS